jgi:hypothetical protein
MLYELRLYHSAQGRMNDIVARMRDLLPPMLEKHQFPTPLGQWVCIAGKQLPLYVWMLGWESLEHRAQCFGSLYADSEWDKIRIATNGSRDTVQEQDIIFMKSMPCMKSLQALPKVESVKSTLFELRIQRYQYGKLPRVNKILEETDFPILTELGAKIEGCFETISGAPIPSILYFVRWKDYQHREVALNEFDQHPQLIAARNQEISELNNHYLQEYDNYLLRATDYGDPQPFFGII